MGASNGHNGRMNVGVIGCGNISNAYLTAGRKFPILNLVACADVDMARAEAKAAEHGIKALSVSEMLADPTIDMVVNLTIPSAHFAVAMSAIEAGKHIYNEKPLALTREEGQAMLDAAKQKNVRIGSAPDTFFCGPLQTCRKLIDDGIIGRPVAATAFMMGHGPEAWHPDPEFFYKFGAGPLFDMGPYYLTTLVHLLGGVEGVTAATRISFPERVIGSQPKAGQMIKVDVPTHTVGLLHFANGALGTIITSFDVWASEVPRIEIYGSEGTLSVPDPNMFNGTVRVFRHDQPGWQEVALTHGYTDNLRSIGAADMAVAIRDNRAHRASGALAFHVLDIMQTIYESAEQGRYLPLTSKVERPEALPVGASGLD
jgi:predicted dehydrogenase